MERVILDIKRDSVIELLYDLERLDMVSIISNESEHPTPLSKKYRGRLTAAQAEDFRRHLEQMRNEWDSNI